MTKQLKTSWETSAKWYGSVVGSAGHYYHDQVIFPKLLKSMNLKEGKAKLLDLGCGQGVLARKIPPKIPYTGIDLSQTLIKEARRLTARKDCQFDLRDITRPFQLKERDFTHGCLLLVLQNLQNPSGALKNMARHLAMDGKLFIVLNHPCFRIPRMSHWGEDDKQRLQYRRVDGYLSEQQIPIQTHPFKRKEAAQTWSFHYPLERYSQWLMQAGFAIVSIEEWASNKASTGKKAKMENRARREFPLFMSLICKKITAS